MIYKQATSCQHKVPPIFEKFISMPESNSNNTRKFLQKHKTLKYFEVI
jgi:hypothetical protein